MHWTFKWKSEIIDVCMLAVADDRHSSSHEIGFKSYLEGAGTKRTNIFFLALTVLQNRTVIRPCYFVYKKKRGSLWLDGNLHKFKAGKERSFDATCPVIGLGCAIAHCISEATATLSLTWIRFWRKEKHPQLAQMWMQPLNILNTWTKTYCLFLLQGSTASRMIREALS